MFKLRMHVPCITNTQPGHGWRVPLIGLELATDPLPQGDFVDYDFLKLHYISHTMEYVSPLRVAALTLSLPNATVVEFTVHCQTRDYSRNLQKRCIAVCFNNLYRMQLFALYLKLSRGHNSIIHVYRNLRNFTLDKSL